MKRLREGSAEPLARRAAELLEAAQPVEDPFLKARVRAALDRPRRRQRRQAWRVVLAALMVLVLAASARAMLRRFEKRLLPAPAAAPMVKPDSPVVRVEPLPPPEIKPVAPPWRVHVAAARPPAVETLAVPAPAAPPPTAVPPATVAPPAEDPREAALVVEAMTRLRRERDPAGARKLLEDYLRRFPDGVLAEEATALSIEAAQAAHDLARAATLGQRYMSRWPGGRFHEAAEQAAGGSP